MPRSRKVSSFIMTFGTFAAVMGPGLARASDTAGKIDTGDTAWMLISTALVMLMTPGLAMFYGGMVRSKNVLGTIMHSFIAIALVSVQWVLFGYSLAFGPDVNGLIGNLSWAGLAGVGTAPNADYAATVPHLAFMAYQMMFAVITPALISGAFAERLKFSAFLIFSLAWTTIVYDPVAHWVWGAGGWMKRRLCGVSYRFCVCTSSSRLPTSRGPCNGRWTPSASAPTACATCCWFETIRRLCRSRSISLSGQNCTRCQSWPLT